MPDRDRPAGVPVFVREGDAPPGRRGEPTPPRRDEIEALAAEEFAALPPEFRASCADLVIRVEDFPEPDVLRYFGLDDRFGLLGLFHGLGLPFQSTSDVGRMPNVIFLYRRPILAYRAAHEDTLREIVRHVLVHEIGHHFGLSDADMEWIEAQAGE